ncbi:MAG: Fur family transcriptional regulator [Pyrinomonadaceae bacterium]
MNLEIMASKNNKFQRERELFYEHIQDAGLRRTSQRDLILDVFLATDDHVSSEDLYMLVHSKDESVGHTTVYRTLKLLTEAGLARQVRLGDGRTYYELDHDHEHHDHMICTECGAVIEFFSAEIEALQDAMANKFRFKPTYHSLRILGICEACDLGTKNIGEKKEVGTQKRVRVKSVVG